MTDWRTEADAAIRNVPRADTKSEAGKLGTMKRAKPKAKPKADNPKRKFREAV